jgi:hypothetical protein
VVLLETAAAARLARRKIRASGLTKRVRVEAGDFRRAVPSGGDLYLLSFVLHNWDDRLAQALLRRCARAMSPGATLLIVENLLPEPHAKLLDLEMLVFTDGGRERDLAELRALLRRAGFPRARRAGRAGSATLISAKRST